MKLVFFCNAPHLARNIFIIKADNNILFTYHSVNPNWTYRDGSKFPYEYFKRK